MNSKERLATMINGMESNGQPMVMSNVKTIEELAKAEAINKFNDAVEEKIAKLDEHKKKLDEFREVLFKDGVGELKATSNHVMVSPFSQNPFQTIKKTESGLIYDLGGTPIEYKSNETGEIEEEEAFILVGLVEDVGADCKEIEVGDLVFYNKASFIKLPFYRSGLVIVPEQRIFAKYKPVIEKLKQE